MSDNNQYLQISGDRAKLKSYSGDVRRGCLLLKIELEIQSPEDYGYYLSVLGQAEIDQKLRTAKKADGKKGGGE